MSRQKQRISFPLDRLDVAVSDQDARPGTLRAVINLCALGTTEEADGSISNGYFWSPVETAEQRVDLSDELSRNVLAIGTQVRQRAGGLTDAGATEATSLERLILLVAGDPERTAGDVGGTTLVKGGSQTGTSLLVDGFTKPTGTVKAGATLTIAGVSGTYTVAADAAIVGGEATLTLTEALASSPADDAAVTFAASFLVTDAIYVADPSVPIVGAVDEEGNPATRFEIRKIYDFTDSKPGRRAQFAQVGASVFIAISEGDASSAFGVPEMVLELRDDEILPFEIPGLPVVSVTAEALSTNDGLEVGWYTWRYAWQFRDGSTGPLSRPYTLLLLVAGDPASVKLTFAIDSFPESLSAGYDDLISGVAIYMSPRLGVSDGTDILNAVFSSPTYHVATIEGATTSNSVEVGLTTDEIVGLPVAEEDQLAQHHIRAAAAFAYNKRLHLGDVAYDFRPLEPEEVLVGLSGSGSYQFRIGLTIKTAQGIFERISRAVAHSSATPRLHAFEQPAGTLTPGPFGTNGNVAYPDRRATQISIYRSDDGGSTWETALTLPLRKATNANVAYSESVTYTLPGSGSVATLDLAVNEDLDHDVNRLLVSDVNQPRSMRARRAYFVGNGPTDAIIGMASNALPISEGQYGQWPFYVLCAESVYAGQVGGGDIAYQSFEVISKRGCVGRYAFANVDNVVAFASRDGVWMIRPGLDELPVSEPLAQHRYINEFYTCLTFDTALGYYNDRTRGRRELWVAAGRLVFTYAIGKNKWAILDRERRQFLLFKNVLYGVTKRERDPITEIDPDTLEEILADPPLQEGEFAEGIVVDEAGDPDAEIDVIIRTARIHFGALGTWKRLYKIWVRQRGRLSSGLLWRLVDLNDQGLSDQIAGGTFAREGTDAVAIVNGLALFPYVEVYGRGVPGEGLESVGFEYRTLVEHRRPETMPELATADDPYQFYLTYVPWDCREGIKVIPPGLPWWELVNVLATLPLPLECHVRDVFVNSEPTSPWWELVNISGRALDPGAELPPLECHVDDVLCEFEPDEVPWWELSNATLQLPHDDDPDQNDPPTITQTGFDEWDLLTPKPFVLTFEDDSELERFEVRITRFNATIHQHQAFGRNADTEPWASIPLQVSDQAQLVLVNTTAGYTQKRLVLIGEQAVTSIPGATLAQITAEARDDQGLITTDSYTITAP